MELKVMSFNIRCDCDPGTEAWGARFVNLVSLIRNAAPDLIGFQEPRHHQYLDLQNRFPDYGSVGAGRDDGKDAGERAAIFYKKDRFTLLDSGGFWLSETPHKPSLGWDAVCIRICTFAKLLDKATGKEFVHYNTHLDHSGPTAKKEGALLVRTKILTETAPAFITGDFNMGEHTEPYQILTSHGLADAKYSAKATMSHGTFHGYNPGPDMAEKSPIDYLFFSMGKFEINSYEVLVNGGEGCYTSDHYPVLVGMVQG